MYAKIQINVETLVQLYFDDSLLMLMIYEPRHEKTNILHMRKQGADQLRGNREADQRLCFRYIDSTIPLLSKCEISSL